MRWINTHYFVATSDNVVRRLSAPRDGNDYGELQQLRSNRAQQAQLAPALRSGHISGAMASHLGGQLLAMHVPPAKVQMMGLLITGHATNSTVASLLSGMTPAARNAVMSAMPVSAGRIVVGVILHFAYAGFLGVTFAALIGAAAWMAIPGLRTSAGIITSAVAGARSSTS